MKILWLFVVLFLCYTSLASGKTHYPFKGCFKDNSQRDMKDGVFVQHNSHKFCANRCKGKGYAYFGVQNGQDCWCGHSYNNDKVKHARVKYSECNKPCTGNADEKCGNAWRMAVYATYNLDKNFIACEHEGTRDLQCPSGSVIKVNSAYYGRQSTTECGNDNTVCVAKGSEQTIVDLCHGKQSCTINPQNSVFGDPCHETVKYVEVDYNCIEGKLYTKVQDKFQKLNEEIQQLNEDNAILEKQNEQLQADIKQLHSKDSSFDNAIKELENRFEKQISELKEENTSDHCPLGMENNFISDTQISASSHWSSTYTPKKGRLNSVNDEAGYAAWVPSSNNHVGGWIQIDLLQPKTVTGVITQGRGDNTYGIQYTKTYNVYYGNSPSNINAILDNNGKTKVFNGNFDRNTKVVNFFDKPVEARYIRIVAQSYYTHVALRLELLSC